MKDNQILVLITNLGAGGAQKVFRQQVSLISEEYPVVASVFNEDGALEIDKQADIVMLEVDGGGSLLQKASNFINRVRRLRSIQQEKNVDLTISHLEGADYVSILAGGSKTICWIHGSKRFDRNIVGALGFVRHRILMPLLYRRADHIVAVSKGIAKEIAGYVGGGRVPVTTIYNGFDIPSVIEASKQSVSPEFEHLAKNNRIIIAHCRMSNQKNLAALLSIFSEVVRDTPCKLVLIGDGEERKALLALSEKLKLSIWSVWEREHIEPGFDVYFLGHQTNPLKYLRLASLFAMTSAWEGFPLALCEALIVGIPVISADCPTGPREILLPDSPVDSAIALPVQCPLGMLMPMVSPDEKPKVTEWANIIKSMLQSSVAYKESQAHRELLEMLDVTQSAKATMDVIKKVISTKRR